MSTPARVVVAEDEAIIRLDLVETLRAEGYEVVADTGRGIDAAFIPEALDAFRQEDTGHARSHEGAGLGLGEGGFFDDRPHHRL